MENSGSMVASGVFSGDKSATFSGDPKGSAMNEAWRTQKMALDSPFSILNSQFSILHSPFPPALDDSSDLVDCFADGLVLESYQPGV